MCGFVLKCQLTKEPKALYYAGYPHPNKVCILWEPEADNATVFNTRSEARDVAWSLLRYKIIESFRIEVVCIEEPTSDEVSKYEEDTKIPENEELLDMAIKDLDKVIDYLYAETTEKQAFRDLLNVITKLKTLQFQMKVQK